MTSKIKFTNAPFIQDIQKWFAGRTFNQQNRYQDVMSPRPGPKPNLPPGVHSSLSNNYYFKHDARRLAKEPISINPSKLLSSSKDAKAAASTSVTPGNVYKP